MPIVASFCFSSSPNSAPPAAAPAERTKPLATIPIPINGCPENIKMIPRPTNAQPVTIPIKASLDVYSVSSIPVFRTSSPSNPLTPPTPPAPAPPPLPPDDAF